MPGRSLDMVLLAAEVHLPQSAVIKQIDRGLDRVDISAALSQLDIKQGVHARTAQDVAEQHYREARLVVASRQPRRQHGVSLMQAQVLHAMHRRVDRRHHPRHKGRPLARQRAEQPLGKALHDTRVLGAHHKEDHRPRHVQPAEKRQAVGRRATRQRIGVTQDVVPQRAAGKHDVLNVVVRRLGGCVAIGRNLLSHHIALTLNLRLGKGRIPHHVGNQLGGTRQVARRIDTIEHRRVLGSEGVEFASHTLHAIEDVPRATVLGALEDGVLHKVGKAVAVIRVVTAAGIHRHATPAHSRVGTVQMQHPQPVAQRGDSYRWLLHHMRDEK